MKRKVEGNTNVLPFVNRQLIESRVEDKLEENNGNFERWKFFLILFRLYFFPFILSYFEQTNIEQFLRNETTLTSPSIETLRELSCLD